MRTTLAALAAIVAVAVVVSGAGSAPSRFSGCKVPSRYDSAAASSHTASFTNGGIEAVDSWGNIVATCNGQKQAGTVKATMTLHPVASSRRFTGKVVIGWSLGVPTGSLVGFTARGTTSCRGSVCTFSGTLTPQGTRKGAGSRISGTFDSKHRTFSSTLTFLGGDELLD